MGHPDCVEWELKRSRFYAFASMLSLETVSGSSLLPFKGFRSTNVEASDCVSASLKFYLRIESVSLPMLSYPGRQVTSSCEIASLCIQGLLEVYFKINK